MKKIKRKSLAEGSKPDVSEEVKDKGLRDFKEGSVMMMRVLLTKIKK
jgi:hypothetical protein